MPFAIPEIQEVPKVDEKKKLFDNFNQGINTNLNPNLNENNDLNKIMSPINSNLNNMNNKNNYNNNLIPLSAYDNSYHRSQYFSNSNDYYIKMKNEDLEKKYATYRKPEYVHSNYKTVSKFPAEEDENSNEVFDDPVFLEGKLEDQNKLKVKVIIFKF